ncbi:protein LDOC1-like [Pleurodeles waltl]|uniref:protein LDOC1-like n=1 Tax=Pleurodeles waltl TaxID=8319 RepID=UPI00370951FA
MVGPHEDVIENVQSMLHTVQQQAQESPQLRTENTALRQALTSQLMDIPPVSTSTPRYSRDPHKVKEILDSLKVFFDFRPFQFSSDIAKVVYLISALSGSAQAWVTPLVSTEDPVLSDYPVFFKLFKQMFEQPGLEAAAEEALCNIQHYNQDVLQYMTRFKLTS